MISRDEFAEKLIAADEAERKELLLNCFAGSSSELAFRLKDIAQEAWTTDPTRTQRAASALTQLSAQNGDAEIAALANWADGIAVLTRGDNQAAINCLESAVRSFHLLKKELLAAQTQVALLYALALQGSYERAIETGKNALAVFINHNDELSSGKIEKNLGNIFVRRHDYPAAQAYLEAAQKRFLRLNSETQIAMIDNSLAIVYALQNDFRRAEDLYLQALNRAEKADLAVTKAETEASLGNLALFRGRYDEALKFLEKSRSGYARLRMPHQTAIADLEIADVYLELNLLPEAQEIYRRIAVQFAAYEMRAEEARTRANYGRTLERLGETSAALTELEKAETLYHLEENYVGAASVKLILGNLKLREKNYQAAKTLAAQAETIFRRANSPRNALLSQLARGESERCAGNFTEAQHIFADVWEKSASAEQPQIAWAAANALGLLAKEEHNFTAAEQYLQQAVKIIESLRSPLAADEFRTAFFTDKLAPYQTLAELCRMDSPRRTSESFGWIERARSQSLLDLLANSEQAVAKLTDSPIFQNQLDNLREELNWFYRRLERPTNEIGARDAESENLRREIKQRESEINRLVLQSETGREQTIRRTHDFALPKLQNALGERRVLIEFAVFDGEFAAFVIDGERIELRENLGAAAEIQEILEQLHFQFGTLRYGAAHLQKHLGLLTARANRLLQNLYEILLRPLEELIGEKHLIFVPAGNLHYVPFHALFDGENYLLESREISFAPSAAVLQNLLETEDAGQPHKTLQKILAVGFADERLPQVEREVNNLAEIWPAESVVLSGASATFAALKENLERQPFDVLHLACHGRFRPENPLFSALHLSDGWATVREAARLRLKNALVVLSACETGLSQIAAGEELLGLVRGFLAAGANALVISLWAVEDAATAALMRDFYAALKNGNSLAASLRNAQRQFILQDAHPYFWAPFILTGKW